SILRCIFSSLRQHHRQRNSALRLKSLLLEQPHSCWSRYCFCSRTHVGVAPAYAAALMLESLLLTQPHSCWSRYCLRSRTHVGVATAYAAALMLESLLLTQPRQGNQLAV
ncbi:MAG: hypothetical protein ACK5OQ_15425, partial [Burkholderiales bacterium]